VKVRLPDHAPHVSDLAWLSFAHYETESLVEPDQSGARRCRGVIALGRWCELRIPTKAATNSNLIAATIPI
jgi:hypothetical protein